MKLPRRCYLVSVAIAVAILSAVASGAGAIEGISNVHHISILLLGT